MNYGQIIKADVANGEGIRLSLFVSGCRNHCKGCFNEKTWDFNYGVPYTNEVEEMILSELSNSYYKGLSVLGGEPLEHENIETVTSLCKKVKELTNKDIWLYTGYTYEDVKHYEIFRYIDVVVDGKFIEELKDITLKFRGSSNQRIINLKEVEE